MNERKTSLFENGLIWFGAGVSIAEILTGTYFASMGLKSAICAIVLGHVIGCTLLFLAGNIGGISRRSAMETVKMSFGQRGALLFVLLNIVQLVGWTAIMIYDGALAVSTAMAISPRIWCVVIGALVVLWIAIGIRDLKKLNIVAMTALFLLTVVLCVVIFNAAPAPIGGDALSFGAALELSIAMPLSWLPLISDYTREAKAPKKATAVSVVVYGVISSWMYFIGMGTAMVSGGGDIALIMVKAGLGVAALFIIVLSTVTTSFLDAYSAGVSAESLSGRIKGKTFAIIVAVLGTVAAMIFPMDDITDFLYFIGSVFAPMIAVMIADFYLLKDDHGGKVLNGVNLILWAVGFLLYRLLLQTDLPCGNTLPAMAATLLLCLAVGQLRHKRLDRREKP